MNTFKQCSRMTKLFGLILSTIFLLTSSFEARGIEAGRHQSLLLEDVAVTTLRSIEISLQEMQHARLVEWLKKVAPPKDLSGRTLKDIASSLQLYLVEHLALAKLQHEQDSLVKAVQRSIRFLRLDQRLLCETLPIPVDLPRKEELEGLTTLCEDANSCVDAVQWPGVDHYTTDRLGPLRALIGQLGPKDRVILTNSSDLSVYGKVSHLEAITRYHIPLSSYGKTICLAVQKDGRKTLVLADFDSKAYLIHFGLLLNRFRHINNLQFRLYEHISPVELNQSYSQLLQFANEHPAMFSSLDAIVIGYSDGFERLWQEYSSKEAVQDGFPGENWKICVYQFPYGIRVGVLSGDVDYYGEGLAKQLENLFDRFPVKKVFFGGSGGAVIPHTPYGMYYPTTIRSQESFETRNVLTGSSDAGTHISVDSPLLESPLRLKQFRRQTVKTIDMEAGHLARLAQKRDIQLGVGILVTDFPIGYGSLGVSLGKQNFMSKRASREDFVHKVEGAIRNGEKTYFHFIERLTERPLLDISRQTLKDLRASIGTLSPEEQKFVGRLFSLTFRIVVRMSPGRLHWTLKDGALFSTGLINSLGTKTDPFTPKLEDEMFGAFDYVFASYCTGLGQRMYGDVAVLLKPEVLARSWGSRASGWRVAGYNKGAALQVHQRNFLEEVIHPDHFREAIGLQAVYRFRRLSPRERSMLMERSTKTWPPLLYELGCGKLELKIKSYVLRQEIERVYLPQTARGEIPGMLRTFGIPFEYYNPGLKAN